MIRTNNSVGVLCVLACLWGCSDEARQSNDPSGEQEPDSAHNSDDGVGSEDDDGVGSDFTPSGEECLESSSSEELCSDQGCNFYGIVPRYCRVGGQCIEDIGTSLCARTPSAGGDTVPTAFYYSHPASSMYPKGGTLVGLFPVVYSNVSGWKPCLNEVGAGLAEDAPPECACALLGGDIQRGICQ